MNKVIIFCDINTLKQIKYMYMNQSYLGIYSLSLSLATVEHKNTTNKLILVL